MIRRATKQDIPDLAALAVLLWESGGEQELKAEFEDVVERTEEGVCFLSVEDRKPVGFACCRLRHDYVEGTVSSPVGYLEGIFVKSDYRRRGCARELLDECERWARDMGCREFASDCELGNDDSLAFHLNAGFTEANRLICFTKKL